MRSTVFGHVALAVLRRIAGVLLACLCFQVQADLSIVGTRFIYPEGLNTLPIRVGNDGQSPLLLQAWLDRGDERVDPSRLTVPFVLSPPLSRLDPQQRAVLSVRYSGEPLPADRESLFWLNFLEVPSAQGMEGNQLRMTYRLRMKLLYRPRNLPGSVTDAVRQMAWSLRQEPDGGWAVNASNPTPYHVSLAELEVIGGSHPMRFQGVTVEPFGSTRLALPGIGAVAIDAAQVRYQVAMDSGETLSGSAPIHP